MGLMVFNDNLSHNPFRIGYKDLLKKKSRELFLSAKGIGFRVQMVSLWSFFSLNGKP